MRDSSKIWPKLPIESSRVLRVEYREFGIPSISDRDWGWSMTQQLHHWIKTREENILIRDCTQTRNLVTALWAGSNPRQRRESNFLILLMQLAWTNEGKNQRGRKSTRKWRNEKIATYLHREYVTESQLAEEISATFNIKTTDALRHLEPHTGITHYYNSFRPAASIFVDEHAIDISSLFKKISSATSTNQKIRKTFDVFAKTGQIEADFESGRKSAMLPMNALSPVLACLDPDLRFPIMNARTKRLLRFLRKQPDENGAIELSKQIGSSGIANSFELDACAIYFRPKVRKP